MTSSRVHCAELSVKVPRIQTRLKVMFAAYPNKAVDSGDEGHVNGPSDRLGSGRELPLNRCEIDQFLGERREFLLVVCVAGRVRIRTRSSHAPRTCECSAVRRRLTRGRAVT